MKRFVWALGAAALLALAQPASAQPAGALGKALPVSDDAAGTVTVRVVDGAPSRPVVGIDVELIVSSGGSARAARTDAEGRATFVKLPAGDSYVARVTLTSSEATADGQEQKKVIDSERFQVPAQGGLRILLSTRPWQGGAPADGEATPGMDGMAAGMAGMAGMPNPREMSGVSRPQPGDPRGQLTVRVVRGQMSNNVADHPVHLVGYAADGAITRVTGRTDAGGRVVFEKLISDKVAYYAMTDLPRQVGDRTVSDRVRSGVIMMPPEVGLRLLLAGQAPDGGAAPVEDLARVTPQDSRLGPGEVLVRLLGQPEGVRDVELMRIDEAGATSVARASVYAGSPSNVRGLVDENILQ
ncbi:MAG TPA: carboxypeptidase-like regulatory domain-containing protein, partial [Haliangium sp.]|nr:carboxypeptidase-like regulatory domain-containing protein [Haliangium sp.]